MNLPPSLTLCPGGAHFAQVLLRQKLGQVLDYPHCLSWSLLFPLALDSAVECGMEALLWVSQLPPLSSCPSPLHLGRSPVSSWACQAFSSTFPFQGNKTAWLRGLMGRGRQFIFIISFYCCGWRTSAGLAGGLAPLPKERR